MGNFTFIHYTTGNWDISSRSRLLIKTGQPVDGRTESVYTYFYNSILQFPTKFFTACYVTWGFVQNLYRKDFYLFSFFALASSSAMTTAMSRETNHSLAASMILSSVSPPSSTSGRLCTSSPARWSVHLSWL